MGTEVESREGPSSSPPGLHSHQGLGGGLCFVGFSPVGGTLCISASPLPFLKCCSDPFSVQ